MAKFNIGDKVIGNRLANCYCITREGFIGTVVDIRNSSYFYISCPLSSELHNGIPCYYVKIECFDIYDERKTVTNEETLICNICGGVIENGSEYLVFEDKIICHDCETEKIVKCEDCGRYVLRDEINEFEGNFWCDGCYERNTVECERCGERFSRYDMNRTGDGDSVCDDCLSMYYTYCDGCGDYYDSDDMRTDRHGNDLCVDCWENRNDDYIHEYYYKPEPIFYGDSDDGMYIGVELEIDGAGEDGDNAEILDGIINEDNEHAYFKHDGSLDEGFEIVSHPATLEYHTENIKWQRTMTEALSMEYRSHDASTCGLHCHISRDGLGKDYDEQEDTISKIIFFVELHWNEILKFSRRSEYTMNRWASRYGIEVDTKKTYEKAKNESHDRYKCINLTNEHTVEFRMFRGTLRYNTFLATLQFVDEVCRTCKRLSEKEVETQCWNDFVASIDSEKKPELITYLKERNLYTNDIVECDEEEM